MRGTFFHVRKQMKMSDDPRPTPFTTVCVSGGFDPVHIGHLRMIQEAAEYGHVIVIVNSDDWLMRKKGYIFMPFEERCEILKGFTATSKTTLKHLQIKRLVHFADVVLTGQTTVLVAVNHQPAIALGVACGAIKGKGLLGQPLDQCRPGWVLSS